MAQSKTIIYFDFLFQSGRDSEAHKLVLSDLSNRGFLVKKRFIGYSLFYLLFDRPSLVIMASISGSSYQYYTSFLCTLLCIPFSVGISEGDFRLPSYDYIWNEFIPFRSNSLLALWSQWQYKFIQASRHSSSLDFFKSLQCVGSIYHDQYKLLRNNASLSSSVGIVGHSAVNSDFSDLNEDEYKGLSEYQDLLCEFVAVNPHILFYFKPHPHSRGDLRKNFIVKLSRFPNLYVLPWDSSLIEFLNENSFIISFVSNVSLQCWLSGRNCISLISLDPQKFLRRGSWHNGQPLVTNLSELQSYYDKHLKGEDIYSTDHIRYQKAIVSDLVGDLNDLASTMYVDCIVKFISHSTFRQSYKYCLYCFSHQGLIVKSFFALLQYMLLTFIVDLLFPIVSKLRPNGTIVLYRKNWHSYTTQS